jgi:acetyltransferase-like isoleucine patch superfamily enzyme
MPVDRRLRGRPRGCACFDASGYRARVSRSETSSRFAERVLGDVVYWAWRHVERLATVGHTSRQSRRFARFGRESTITFPSTVLHGESRIEIGEKVLIGPYATLSAGMPVPLDDGEDPIVSIGDRCWLGKGIGIVAHERVEIGDDTCAGHFVYITDQNHGYENVDEPISTQLWKNAPVKIGADCWLGHGSVILPGTTIGRHVVVAAGSVVTGEIPDFTVVAGAPARIVRRYVPDLGWVPTDAQGNPRAPSHPDTQPPTGTG